MTAARLPRVISAVGDTDTIQVFVGGDPAVSGMATKAALLDDINVADDLVVTDSLTVGGEVTLTGPLEVGNTDTERARMKMWVDTGVVVVAVPSIANDAAENADSVAVDVSNLTFTVSIGDAVQAIPLEALPTDCLQCGAYVTGTDTITVTYATKEGGAGVTGANKNYRFLICDLT